MHRELAATIDQEATIGDVLLLLQARLGQHLPQLVCVVTAR